MRKLYYDQIIGFMLILLYPFALYLGDRFMQVISMEGHIAELGQFVATCTIILSYFSVMSIWNLQTGLMEKSYSMLLFHAFMLAVIMELTLILSYTVFSKLFSTIRIQGTNPVFWLFVLGWFFLLQLAVLLYKRHNMKKKKI